MVLVKDKKFKSKSKEAYISWYEQGLRDLEVADFCYNNNYYEWACFCYQEATVKILKALLKKIIWNLLDIPLLVCLKNYPKN